MATQTIDLEKMTGREIVQHLAVVFEHSLGRLYGGLRAAQDDGRDEHTLPELHEAMLFAVQLDTLVDAFLHGPKDDSVFMIDHCEEGLDELANDIRRSAVDIILPTAMFDAARGTA